MKVIYLSTDEEIKKAYEDPNMTIYFRDGSEGDYENIRNNDLDVVIDATCHGFELVAVEGYDEDVLYAEDIDLPGEER